VPSNDSAKPEILKLLAPTLPSTPTAMHALGVTQETLLRTFKFLPA
jgi:hypothetical protein